MIKNHNKVVQKIQKSKPAKPRKRRSDDVVKIAGNAWSRAARDIGRRERGGLT